MRNRLPARLILLLLLLASLPAEGFSSFGKNKVSYRDFDWQVLESDNFDIHFYPEERELAERTVALAEAAYEELSLRMGHVIHRRIPLFLYANVPSFQQTNTVDILLPESVGGLTEFRKGRVVMPNSGDLSSFASTLLHELVHVFSFDIILDNVMARGRGNYAFPHLWFFEGIAEYYSQGDSTELAIYMRDLVLEERLLPLSRLVGVGPHFIVYKQGQSVCVYLAERFGEEALVDLLRGCYASEFFEDVLKDVLGIDLAQLDEDWRRWVRRRYLPEVVERFSLDEIGRRLSREGELGLAPSYAERNGEPGYVYLSNYYGYQTLYWAPLSGSGRRERLVTAGRDPTLETLHMFSSDLDVDSGGRVVFSARAGSGDELIIYDLEARRVLQRRGLPDVVSLAYPSWGEDSLVVVGLDEAGRSDLYLVELPGWEVERLTEDFFYEADPIFTPDGEGVVFAANYGPDEYGDQLNLWRLELSTGERTRLTQGGHRDRAPFYDDAGRLHFFSDRDGAMDLYRLEEDGGVVQMTALFSGLFRGEFTPRGELLGEALIGHNFAVYLVDDFLHRPLEPVEPPPDDYAVTAFDDADFIAGVDATLKEYRTEFTLDVLRADTAFDPEFGTGFGTALGLTDLTGDQRIIFQLYSAGSSTAQFFEYFNVAATYLNLKSRLNWGAGLFHYVDDYFDISTRLPYFERRYGGVGILSLPFSRFTRLEGNLVLRHSERYDYIGESWSNRFLGSTYLGFVYDTTLWDMIGPIDGMRINLQFGQTYDLSAGHSSYHSLWGDFRHYLRTSRRTALATRLVGRLVEGRDARRAYFGGPMTMRGYPYGYFSGTRLYMGNVEWRFPLLDYLSLGLPIGALTFYTVQGALFFDVAAAWNEDEPVPDPRGSFGLGFRVGLGPFLALRFDLAWLTDFQSVSDRAEFQFFIGWNY